MTERRHQSMFSIQPDSGTATLQEAQEILGPMRVVSIQEASRHWSEIMPEEDVLTGYTIAELQTAVQKIRERQDIYLVYIHALPFLEVLDRNNAIEGTVPVEAGAEFLDPLTGSRALATKPDFHDVDYFLNLSAENYVAQNRHGQEETIHRHAYGILRVPDAMMIQALLALRAIRGNKHLLCQAPHWGRRNLGPGTCCFRAWPETGLYLGFRAQSATTCGACTVQLPRHLLK